ncbi:hypothetical protein BRADO4369 [Bradyrhizobium sp. ORS 278]|nr:hypothetical protein BRADO4369 [Bradyrhizobium sp. ORS 278]
MSLRQSGTTGIWRMRGMQGLPDVQMISLEPLRLHPSGCFERSRGEFGDRETCGGIVARDVSARSLLPGTQVHSTYTRRRFRPNKARSDQRLQYPSR